ncbi:hypothetical protein, partial [Allorhizocola rhizosphaerae]|uniref:hypothetical protein n=1 Tax=Allorhizocola rhizosphaerae TaxID=1872709 RepID=UPI001B8C5B9A
ASCLVAAGLPTDVFTYRWNTGKTSTVTYTVTTVVRLANGTTNVTSTGPITAGVFQGKTAVREVILPALSITQCLSPPGLTRQTGIATLTFLL